MNISIGTAQFMSNYGINRISKDLSFIEKSKLIKSAQYKNVLDIDTAFSYGNTHKELGKIGIRKFRVTTKLPIISLKTKNYECIRNSWNSNLPSIWNKWFNFLFLDKAKEL